MKELNENAVIDVNDDSDIEILAMGLLEKEEFVCTGDVCGANACGINGV